MPEVLSLVNSISSTSIPVEIAHAVNKHTSSQVTMGDVMETPDVDIDSDVKSMNLPIVYFSGDSNFDPGGYKQLWNHLRSNDYEIIHTHHNFSGSVARILGRLQNTPIVNTEHNDHQYFTIPQRAANAATFMIPDANVYNSYSTKSSLGPIEHRLSKRDEVIYNGIDVERITESAEYPLPVDLPDGTLVTNVGVMTEQKNQRIILEAANKIKQSPAHEDIHFVLAGSGPLEEDLRAIATQHGVEDIVTFTGYLPEREHVHSLLHKSDIFLNPSVYEGFCVAAVEAMACELPVIASDIPVLREVIGEHGIFVSNDDAQAIANRIIDSVYEGDATKIRQKGKKMRKRAIAEFPLKRTAIGYHELYEELLD